MHTLSFFLEQYNKLFFKSFLQYIRMKDLDITKAEYAKTLKNRSKSIKLFTSKHEILKLIDNLTKKDLSYLSKLRNIKINDDDDSTKTVINPLAKGTHKKRIVAVFQQLHKKNIIQEILRYVEELKRQRVINKVRRKKLQQEIYRNI